MFPRYIDIWTTVEFLKRQKWLYHEYAQANDVKTECIWTGTVIAHTEERPAKLRELEKDELTQKHDVFQIAYRVVINRRSLDAAEMHKADKAVSAKRLSAKRDA